MEKTWGQGNIDPEMIKWLGIEDFEWLWKIHGKYTIGLGTQFNGSYIQQGKPNKLWKCLSSVVYKV